MTTGLHAKMGGKVRSVPGLGCAGAYSSASGMVSMSSTKCVVAVMAVGHSSAETGISVHGA